MPRGGVEGVEGDDGVAPGPGERRVVMTAEWSRQITIVSFTKFYP